MNGKKDSFFFRLWEDIHHDFRCVLLLIFMGIVAVAVIGGGGLMFHYIEEGQAIRKMELQLERDKLEKQ